MKKTTISIDAKKALTAGEKYTCLLELKMGEEGVPAGGRIRIALPCYWAWGSIQVSDPRKENYVEVSTSNPEVEFITWKESEHSLIVEITRGELKAGDKVRVQCGKSLPGEKSGISVTRWASLTPYANIWARVEASVDIAGEGKFIPVEGSPVILNVRSGRVREIVITTSSFQDCHQEYEVKVAVLDEHRNMVTDYEGCIKFKCTDKKAKFSREYIFKKENRGNYRFRIKLHTPGLHKIVAEDQKDKIPAVSNPIVCESSLPSYRLFWGDIHGHSNLSDGVCSVDDYYIYARDAAGLDFTALTDHDAPWGRWMVGALSDAEWEMLREKASRYHKEGNFVTFPAYEWTSNTHGHRNVYYLEDAPPIWRCSDPRSDTPEKLWDKLKGRKAMVIPHHPSGLRFCIANGCAVVDWSIRNDELQRFVEIFSVHGNSEYFGHPQNFMLMYQAGHFVQDALRMGHRLGIMSSSDSHNGHPGLSGLYDYHSYDPESGMVDKSSCRGSLVGVYSKELTREAIWEALYNRRCYAATGKRIILNFQMDGHLMGEEYSTRSEREIFVKVMGTAPIASIEILRDNRVIFTHKGKKESEEITWCDRTPLNDRGFYYYVRVTQKDGEMAWSSPIWVSP